MKEELKEIQNELICALRQVKKSNINYDEKIFLIDLLVLYLQEVEKKIILGG